MLSPEPMRHLTVVVLTADMEGATQAIARVGVLHLLDVRRAVEPVPAIRPLDVGDQQSRLASLAQTLGGLLRFLDIPPAAPDLEIDQPSKLDVPMIEARAAAIAAEVQPLRQHLSDLHDTGARLDTLLRSVRVLVPLGVPLEQMHSLRYTSLLPGLLPQRNLARVRESLARVPHLLVPAGPAGADGRLLAVALCLRPQHDIVERALRSAQFEPVELPARLRGRPDEVIAQLEAQRAAHRAAIAQVEAERHALATRHVMELHTLGTWVAREQLLVEALGLMGRSERTVVITGWVPAVLAANLERVIGRATGGRCVVRWAEPAALEPVRDGRIPVPILLHNPVLMRPFERLLRAYGLPRYGEIEPTAIVAVAFLTMFGFMFGDVGQGLVLFGIGYFIYRQMFRYRDYAVILMECGVFATAFGFLYGTVFGSEHWLPALWLRPMDDIETLVQTAIAFGIVFLSIGLLLNVANAVRRRDAARLWERNGLLAALAYWTAVGLLIRSLTAGPGAVTVNTAMLWLGLPIGMILLKEPVRATAAALRNRRWPDLSDLFTVLVESMVEVLDTVVSAVSNTATFIRLAAFALSHAGLFLATFSMANAVAHAGGVSGQLGAAMVLLIGNVVIIALEGLIVAIQSVRLEYYEFFSKFYSGGGEAYRPLRLATTQSARL